MASSFVAAGDKDHQHQHQHHHHHHHHHHHPLVSPKNSFKKTWPANSSPPAPSCSHGHNQAVPKCVCAPATHAGSFKCRLHRVNSHGHSAPSAPPPDTPASSTRSVEAQ